MNNNVFGKTMENVHSRVIMDNNVFRKTMENVQSRVNIQLVNEQKKAEELVASPTFQAFKKFTDDLVGIERLSKP